ncbi:AfsR/SARP family transcriptional regulator [Streptomyces sp. Ag109_G2-15]|uniref:AfsR/SARP family transcriptional regulator n=1 Tax=Streptomyces sp. Ag109_G2-15 TaxID=1938850 RepID=UPI000BC81C16|nr:AfsR/SARP family transcriptional regulator [Streptomyces sp. Ag109_G2-15]SOE06845.1 DNA-binding transcriptional activator of the SARP family [Streptomyces sp. Ag109_G2-15]
MRFEVLGSLRVVRGETELDLGFPQQRALLGLLLVHTGRSVRMSEIVDVLWPGQPPASARNVVRRYVGALRRLLEPELPPRAPGRRLLTRTGGYLLEADTDEVDLLCFRDLTRQGMRAAATGRPEEAVRHFADALALWRGPVATGIAEATRAHLHFSAVEREFVRTAQMAADAALLCGRSEQVLPALRRAAVLEPLDEALHARLVLSLAARGLQAEALTAYEDVRRDLAAQLGVPPGPELGAAHARVLRQEVRPAGRDAPPVRRRSPEPFVRPAQLPPDLAVFTGRGTELETLNALADATAATDGVPATVLISGMAGIGKTALAVHSAHRAADRFPDGQLHVELGGFDPRRSALEPAEALRQLLAALGVTARRMPEGVDALAGLYRGLLAGRRLLVLLDGAAGTEQLRPLLPASPGCLTVVTSRNALPGLIAAGARPLRLDLPSAADARAALARRIGFARMTAEPEAVEEIVARCGRLPLALAVVAARATSRRDFPLAALAAELRAAHGSLDALSSAKGAADVRTAFHCSYRTLSARSARLFRLLPQHTGPLVTAGAAAALADLPVREARALLGELAEAHLVTEATPGRYALHELLRAFATELTA